MAASSGKKKAKTFFAVAVAVKGGEAVERKVGVPLSKAARLGTVTAGA